MNINPSAAAASIAGTGRAAARGGEADAQAMEATRQQATADKPGGKSADSNAIDAGDQTSDRDGDGRQLLDQFERHGEGDESKADEGITDPRDTDPRTQADAEGIPPGTDREPHATPGTNLDLEG
jgi:hypothetical protein